MSTRTMNMLLQMLRAGPQVHLQSLECSRLTWEAATQRLLEAAAIRAEEWPSTTERVADLATWNFYRPFSWIEVLSRVCLHTDFHVLSTSCCMLASLHAAPDCRTSTRCLPCDRGYPPGECIR